MIFKFLGRKLTPLGNGFSAPKFEILPVVQMTFLIEVVMNRSHDRQSDDVR